jgi:hypothetical protein
LKFQRKKEYQYKYIYNIVKNTIFQNINIIIKLMIILPIKKWVNYPNFVVPFDVFWLIEIGNIYSSVNAALLPIISIGWNENPQSASLLTVPYPFSPHVVPHEFFII